MSKKPNDGTNTKPLDWMYWNRMPVLTLQQAICLTLNFDPKPYYSGQLNSLYPSSYHELSEIAQAHILDGSLQYLNQSVKNLRVIDWLQWLQTIDIPIPDGWQPTGVTESTEKADSFDSRYKEHYEEAVNTAIAMAESLDVSAPTKQKQLYDYMENHSSDCSVNFAGGKQLKITTIERNVRDGGGNPLQDPRFLEALAQNP